MKTLIRGSVVTGLLMMLMAAMPVASSQSGTAAPSVANLQVTFPTQPVFVDLQPQYVCVPEPCFSQEDCINQPGTVCDLNKPVCKRYCQEPNEWP